MQHESFKLKGNRFQMAVTSSSLATRWGRVKTSGDGVVLLRTWIDMPVRFRLFKKQRFSDEHFCLLSAFRR